MASIALQVALGAVIGGCTAPPLDGPANPQTEPEAAAAPPIAPRPSEIEPTSHGAPQPRVLGPEVSVEPGSGMLRGVVRLTAHARDDAGVTGLRFTEPASLIDAQPRFRSSGTSREATLEAVLDTRDLLDGALRIGVRAENAAGRVTERLGRFTVSNAGPGIRWSTPADGEIVRGQLTIRAYAEDPDGVSTLIVEGDDPPAAGWVDDDPAEDGLALVVDTTRWPEGPRTLTLLARDANGNATRSRRAVVVDNHPTGHLEGRASFGGPVVRGRVRLFACTANGRDGLRVDQCPFEGCPTDESGHFVIPLVDAYDGPVRVRVTASPDTVTLARDPVAESLQPMPASAGLTALMPHPALGPIQVHGVTTLIDATATAWLADRAAIGDALPIADALWGEHACDRCRPGSTDPAETDGAPRDRLTPAVRLELVHAGLYQLAADHTDAASQRGRARATTAWDLLALLRRDLGDGLLDGRSGGHLFDPRIDPHTLRLRLAGSIAALLDRRPDWLLVDREVLRGEAGWLDALARRRSALWPEHPAPLGLDQTPPTVHIITPATDAAVGPDTIVLTAEGADDGIPPALYVVAPPGILVWVDRAEPGHITARLDVRRRSPGPAEIRVVAEDAAGLLAEASVTINVDHHAPRLTLLDLDGMPIEPEAVRFTQARSFGFFAEPDDPEAHLEVDQPAEVRPVGDRAFVAVRDLAPGRNRIDVHAVDPAGNRTTVAFDVHVQLDGPTIELEDTEYMTASQHAPTMYNCRPLDGEPDAPPICSLRLASSGVRLPVSGGALLRDDPPYELEVFPLRPEQYMAPVAYLTITDETGHGVVEVRARQPDGRWRPWRPLQPSAGDHYRLDLSLPQGAPDAGLTRSSDETVEIRAIDAVGHVTVRTLRWRRNVIAPPISIQADPGFAERASPVTPGGYGFGPDEASITGLSEPGVPAVASGIGLARWRVYNPWPIPIAVQLGGQVTVEHSRSNAYAVDGLFLGAEPPCAAGEFYRAAPDWQHPTSGCAAGLAALGTSGERLITRVGVDWTLTTMNAGDHLTPVPGDRITLAPHTHTMIILAAPPAPVRLWPEFSRPAPELDRLYHVSGGLAAVLRTVRIDREAALRWSLTGLSVTTVLPPAGPRDSPVMWSTLDDIHIERVNPPLQQPQGFELR